MSDFSLAANRPPVHANRFLFLRLTSRGLEDRGHGSWALMHPSHDKDLLVWNHLDGRSGSWLENAYWLSLSRAVKLSGSRNSSMHPLQRSSLLPWMVSQIRDFSESEIGEREGSTASLLRPC